MVAEVASYPVLGDLFEVVLVTMLHPAPVAVEFFYGAIVATAPSFVAFGCLLAAFELEVALQFFPGRKI